MELSELEKRMLLAAYQADLERKTINFNEWTEEQGLSPDEVWRAFDELAHQGYVDHYALGGEAVIKGSGVYLTPYRRHASRDRRQPRRSRATGAATAGRTGCCLRSPPAGSEDNAGDPQSPADVPPGMQVAGGAGAAPWVAAVGAGVSRAPTRREGRTALVRPVGAARGSGLAGSPGRRAGGAGRHGPRARAGVSSGPRPGASGERAAPPGAEARGKGGFTTEQQRAVSVSSADLLTQLPRMRACALLAVPRGSF